jgi:hypothetical protein
MRWQIKVSEIDIEMENNIENELIVQLAPVGVGSQPFHYYQQQQVSV